jgi:hypothetical protein
MQTGPSLCEQREWKAPTICLLTTVEKRRREVISAGISQVNDALIANGVLAADNKLNKADILRKGVDYIEQLQRANAELTAALKGSNTSQAEELRALADELNALCAGMRTCGRRVSRATGTFQDVSATAFTSPFPNPAENEALKLQLESQQG